MRRFNSIDDIWIFLDSIPMFQKTGISAVHYSLDNIRKFCGALGNPQKEYPAIHVAGTNGKGTTCHLLEKIYSDAGYNTGLFTSPHLLRYNERVRVNQQEITDQDLLRFFQSIETLLDEIKLSYFEISTALAFWYFADQKVDIAIIEAGLGGRLDSTNIITPEVSVITSIGMDHQNILGDTMEEITVEKAGIIKPDTPLVIGNVTGPSNRILIETAQQKNSECYAAVDLKPEWNNGSVTLKDGEVEIKTLFKEAINKWNVVSSWLVIDVLSRAFPINETQRKSAIEKFTGAPGRFEKLHSEYEWFFSGSHNAQALESSLQAVQAIKSISEAVLVFSVMKDKLNEDMLKHLKGFKKVYFVEQDGERAAKFSDIRGSLDVELMEEYQKEIILNELKTELVIFMGSFYFYPIVKRWTANVS